MSNCVTNEPGPFYHGTRADLSVGDLLAAGWSSNYGERKLSWIYFSATLDAAIWGCELAKGGGHGRIYVIEPTGAFFDDPNLTGLRQGAGQYQSGSLLGLPRALDHLLPCYAQGDRDRARAR
jgi:hypothetical protein